MAAVVTRNPGEDETVADPAKAGGARYRYEMIFDQQRSRAYADTAAELVAVLIGTGYAAATPEDQAKARVLYLTNLLAPMQATILASVDQGTLSEDERAVVLAHRFKAVEVEEWSSEVPLVLLDVHYAPFSDIPAPLSTLENGANPRNLVWLRAVEDLDLLMSLNRVGFISLGESNDFAI